jgi:hypothetical protein
MCVPYMYFDYKTYSYCSIEKKNHTSISSTLKRSGNGTNNASTTGFQRRYNGGKCNAKIDKNVNKSVYFFVNFSSMFFLKLKLCN